MKSEVTISEAIRHDLAKVTAEIRRDYPGFESIHPHVFRHTFATRWVENGGNMKTLQTILGHSNYGITADLYAHVLPDTKQEEMQKVMEAAEFAKQMVALGYYTQNHVSIGYCAQIAGMTEEEFIGLLYPLDDPYVTLCQIMLINSVIMILLKKSEKRLPTIGIKRNALADGTYLAATASIFAKAFGVAPSPKPQKPAVMTAAS